MIERAAASEIKKIAKEFPVVAILGPRQSGKTTLAKMLFPKYRYVSLEDLDVRSSAIEDPRGFLEEYSHKVIIDEIQRAPELFSYLQTHLDAQNKNGSYIITGSHNYLMMESISQSLAGRVGLTILLPLSIAELNKQKKNLIDLMFTGGYPRIYDKKIRPSIFYQSYIATYLERDVRLLKNITDYNKFVFFLKLLAGRCGQIFNSSALSDECGVAHNTIKSWLSVLETSYIIYRLPPYYRNYKKRILKNPKIYFYDTGLVCYLLGLKSAAELKTHYLKGNIFENFIVSDLLKSNLFKGGLNNLFFWQDNHGKEIDLIVTQGQKIKSVEIKSGATLQNSFFKNLSYWQKLTGLPKTDSYLIYTGGKKINKNGIKVLNWDCVENVIK